MSNSPSDSVRSARCRIRYTFQPPPEISWVKDGDQDGDPLELPSGTKLHEALKRLRDNAKPGETFVLVMAEAGKEQPCGIAGHADHCVCWMAPR